MKKEEEKALILFMRATKISFRNLGIVAALAFWVAIAALIVAIVK